ncbi:hypothetical protein [Collimonas fungivorans]|uniref:hypothetical protein n=1 Tax=Collimonas fungivorans TaxID=158899 RepID=UPI0011D1E567|nr:hypothetical protein [Collimonas fungivorans]
MKPFVAKQMIHPLPRLSCQRSTRMRQLRRYAAIKKTCKTFGSGLLCGFVLFAPSFAVGLGWVKG